MKIKIMSNTSVGDTKFMRGEIVEVTIAVGTQILNAGRGVLIAETPKEKLKVNVGVEIDVDLNSDKVKVDADIDVDFDNLNSNEAELEDIIEDIVEDIVESTIEDAIEDVKGRMELEQELLSLPWNELQKKAKEVGIKTYQVKKDIIIEKLLKAINNKQV